MQSIFRYPGGKSRRSVRDWILSHRPPGVAEYREPFVGGGGVFFAADSFQRQWVNDLNAGLIAVYRALQERPADFIARCRAVGAEDLEATFAAILADADADPAFRFYLVNRTAYGGMVNLSLRCRTRFRDAAGWRIVEGDQLDRAAALLAGVRVTCGDFAPLLAEPGDGPAWVYCDPPYVTSRNWPSARVYEHVFAEADHRRFAEAVRRSPHQVAVSYNDDPAELVRSLFPRSDGFHVVEGGWYYGCSTGAVKRPARELLILNYPPPAGALTLRAPDRVPVGRPPKPADQDRRRRVLALLTGPATAEWSVARTAREAVVSQHYVGKVAKEEGIVRTVSRGTDGKVYRASRAA